MQSSVTGPAAAPCLVSGVSQLLVKDQAVTTNELVSGTSRLAAGLIGTASHSVQALDGEALDRVEFVE